MVVGYFRLCLTYYRNKGRFPDIREADKPNIRKKFKFKINLKFLTRVAGIGKPRSLTCGRCKVAVAPAAVAAFGYYHGFVIRYIRHKPARGGVLYKRTARNTQNKVFRLFARAARRTAVTAVFGNVFAAIAEVRQG